MDATTHVQQVLPMTDEPEFHMDPFHIEDGFLGWEIMRGPCFVKFFFSHPEAEDFCRLLNDAWHDGFKAGKQ
jgi:hypothetical protein